MKHQDIREGLALRLYDELSPAEDRALEIHLSECADCAAFADELSATLATWKAAEEERRDVAPDEPHGFDDELHQLVRGVVHATRSRPGSRFAVRGAVLFAAGLAAGVLATLLLRPASHRPEPHLAWSNVRDAPAFVARPTPPPPASSRSPAVDLRDLVRR